MTEQLTTATCPTCKKHHEVPLVEVCGVLITAISCPKCAQEYEAERAQEAKATRQHDREATFKRICPPLYRKTKPARLRRHQLDQVMAWQYGPEGLLLVGPTGVGKTRMAYLLLQRLVMEGVDVVAFDCAGFAHELSRRFGQKRAGAAEDWLDGLARRQLVFFDDIGKTPFTERVEAEFYAIVEKRTANMLPILGTMNMTGEDLKAKTTADRGEPLVRRLREFCKIVSFKEKGETDG